MDASHYWENLRKRGSRYFLHRQGGAGKAHTGQEYTEAT